MTETINWNKPKKGSWAFENPEDYETAKAMLISGSRCKDVAKALKAPQATISGMMARVTKARNEEYERQALARARMPQSLMMWVPA